MADFPGSIFHQRTLENFPGVVYNPANPQRYFAEDLRMLGDEITAIETYLLSLPPSFPNYITYNSQSVVLNGDMVYLSAMA